MNAPTLILIATITVFNMYSAMSDTNEYTKEYPDEIFFEQNNDFHQSFEPAEWGGKTIFPKQKLTLPVNLVIIAHTVTSFCKTFLKCSRQMVAIQNHHLAKGLDDIFYNFVIGGDGNIYIGRGWTSANTKRNQSIIVSFIGNYLHDKLQENTIGALDQLLKEGVKFQVLEENFKIVAHNQTVATLSPGPNIYSFIKDLPNFQKGKIMDE